MLAPVEGRAVVARLAPSPTGALHLGHALSFLATYWLTRARAGRLLLRLEDLDVERAEPQHAAGARADLEWLGIDWDGPARLQSERLEAIVDAARALEAGGLAYPCTCSRGDLRALGAPQAGSNEVRYPGTCRGRYPTLEEAEKATGKAAGLRFLVAPGEVSFFDERYGAQTFSVEREAGDFTILRRNRMPAYQLAVVVDDDFDGVTLVSRGSDLLPSTARQILLARALGFDTPRYFHLPLVTDRHGRRLAKREAALGLSDLRAQGVDPRRIVAWAAHALGQVDDVELTTAREVLDVFDPARIGPAPIPFGPSELARLFGRTA